MLSMAEIREQIQFACNSNGMPELANQIVVELNDRYTSKMGAAYYRLGIIKLSTKLFERASQRDQIETVIHETCHLIARARYGASIRPHGAEWQNAMRACGVTPERCHSVDRTGLYNPHDRYVYFCKTCNKQYLFTRNRITRMQRGSRYICNNCRAVMAL